MKNFCTTFFRGLDMYTTPATLRSRGQAGVASICLGVFSTLLLGLFFALFISNLIGIVNRESDTINYSQTLQKEFNPRTVDNVMFGVTIDLSVNPNVNYDTLQKYYKMSASIWNDKKQAYEDIKFEKCKAENWKLIGEQYTTYFNDWKLNQSYCLPKMQSIYSSKTDLPFAKLKLDKCTGQGCESPSNILKFYQEVITKYQNFPVYFSFLSSYVQANDKDPLKYYIYAPRFATTSQTGQQIYMYLDKFIIDTDISLLPIIEQHEQVSGYTVSQNFFADFYFSENMTSVFEVQIYTSKNIIHYNRNLSKIDQALSYVGGLFGLVIFFFNFFLQPFNQYRYQLMASQSSFNYNTDGKRIRQKQFNFLTFCKYRLYFWLNFITGGRIKWKSCQQIDETLTQSRKLLDVQKLFRRIQFMQRVLWKKTDNNLLMSMTLLQHNSIEQTKKKRMILDYYKQVIQLQQAATVEDAFNDSQKSFHYLKEVRKRLQKNRKKPIQKLSSKGSEQNQNKGMISGSLQGVAAIQPQISQAIKQTKNDALYHSLMTELKLQHCPQHCQKVCKYPQIAEDAQNFQFQEQQKEQYEQIQKEITQAFIDLDPGLKLEVIPKIPIKILHRLRITAIKMRQEKNSQKNSEKQGSQNKPSGKSD